MSNSSIFSTDSFNLATYLLSESCRLISIDKADPKRALFIFEDSEKRKSLTEKFLSYQAQVEPNRFCSAQRNLKQILYQKANP